MKTKSEKYVIKLLEKCLEKCDSLERLGVLIRVRPNTIRKWFNGVQPRYRNIEKLVCCIYLKEREVTDVIHTR